STPSHMAFSPDGGLLGECSERTLRIWDVGTGERLHKSVGHDRAITGLAFIADGRLVTAGDEQTVSCWDFKTGAETDHEVTTGYWRDLIPAAHGNGVLLIKPDFVREWRPGAANAPSTPEPYSTGRARTGGFTV